MKEVQPSLYQLWTALLATFLVTAFHTFPRGVAVLTSSAAPWAILVAGGAAFLLFWPVASLLAKRPGKNLIDLALEAGGRPLAISVALLLGSFLLSGAGIGLRQVSEMVVTGFLPFTPQTFAMASLTAIGALGAAMTPSGLVWIGALYAWPLLICMLLFLVGNLGWGQFRNVLPLTGHGVLPTLGEVLPLTSYFGELIYLAVLSSYLARPRHLVRAGLWAVGTTAATWALVILFYLMVFPIPGAVAVPFPLLEMSRLVQGGRFMERVDALWLIVWTFGTAGQIAAALMTTALLFRDAFRLPDYRGAILPMAIAILAVALFPSNQAGAIAAETFFIRRWGFLIALVLPLMVALLARGRRGGVRA